MQIGIDESVEVEVLYCFDDKLIDGSKEWNLLGSSDSTLLDGKEGTNDSVSGGRWENQLLDLLYLVVKKL